MRVLAVGLDHVGEVSELDASGLVRATGTAGRQDLCHLDNTGVLCGECKVGGCGFSGAHVVGADEGHTELHRRPAGGGSTITGPRDDGRDADCLPERLADSCLQLGGLLGREEFIDVDDELGLQVVGHLVVTGIDLHVTVVHE